MQSWLVGSQRHQVLWFSSDSSQQSCCFKQQQQQQLKNNSEVADFLEKHHYYYFMFFFYWHPLMSESQEQVGVDAEAKSEGNLGSVWRTWLGLCISITTCGLAGGHIYLVMLSAPTGSDIITCSALHSKWLSRAVMWHWVRPGKVTSTLPSSSASAGLKSGLLTPINDPHIHTFTY